MLKKCIRTLAGVFVLISMPALAQTTASIYGTVRDQTGAVVTGARLDITNTLTNETRSTTSNQEGYYTVPELPVGVYTVRAGLQGFKTTIREGIELSLNRNAMVNIELAVGALTEKVVITADAPLVDTASNQMGGLIDQRRVIDLPLNGRNALSLVSLVPGAGALTSTNTQGFQTNYTSINGQRNEDSSWLLDGGDNTSALRNYANTTPNPDAVQEVRVITSNYDAEFGQSVGGVVNIITKSGSNELHGSLFEFLRNRSLNARNFFQATTTPLVQNQYGGSVGGPIVKNKTFFFGSYQDFSQRTSAFQNSALVPTAAQRDGDFSSLVDKNGKPIAIKDPVTGQPFPNNIIPSNRVSPVARKYLDLAIPLPNAPQLGPNGFTQTASQPTDETQFLTKVDHMFSEKHKLTGSYFWDDYAQDKRFLNSVDWVRQALKERQQNVNLHEYWIVSPSTLNHFSVSYIRSAANRLVTPDNVSLNDFGSNFSPLPQGPELPPEIGVAGYLSIGSPIGGPKTADTYTASDTVSWTKGRHDLKFGVTGGLRKLMDWTAAAEDGGTWTFDGAFTGNALADLMLGTATSLKVAQQQYKSVNQPYLYWFAEDKFRVTPRLVLTLGLRYEWNAAPVNPTNQLVTYRAGRQSTCVPQAPLGLVFPCDSGIPRGTYNSDINNYAPRVGLAYDLFGNGKTILRTGYGIFYTFQLLNALEDPQTSVPFSFSETIYNTTLANPYAPVGVSPFPFLTDPAHLQFPTPIAFGNTGKAGFIDPNLSTGYVQQYNFSIQRQMGKDWSAEVAYAGNVSRKLIGSRDINSPLPAANASSANIDQRRPLYPEFTMMSEMGSFTNASYNALQARVEKRFSRGFTLLGSYTLSKSLDTSSWYASDSRWVDQNNIRLDHAPSDFDQRQKLAISGIWQLPFFSGSSGVRKALLAGWSINGIATLYSGQPLLIVSNKDNNFDGVNSDRPNVVGDWYLSPNRSRQAVIQQWFNPAAFQANLPGHLGTLGRNVVMGPGSKGVDLEILKRIRVTESKEFQLRLDSFNAMNWVNLGNPTLTQNSPNFGKITSAGSPRIFQAALKFVF